MTYELELPDGEVLAFATPEEFLGWLMNNLPGDLSEDEVAFTIERGAQLMRDQVGDAGGRWRLTDFADMARELDSPE